MLTRRTGMGLEFIKTKCYRKETKRMKKLFKKFETAMAAVAFAEAGEFETAKEILNEDRSRKTGSLFMQERHEDRKILTTEHFYGEAGK
jgi:hypothetical protein